jgi:putative hydrolase of the HAD superfamily
MPGPRIVCFDLGGVVVRICRTFEEAALAAGVALRPEPPDPRRLEARRSLVASHQRGELDPPAFYRLMSESFEGLYTPAEIAAAHSAVILGEYRGMAELIGAIRHAGLTTACLSNTNEEHWTTLLGMPAFLAIEHRHASHLWGLDKPNASIYRRFERERGASGREILYFDDLVENVDAALALGWDAVLVDHADDPARIVREALRSRGIRLAEATLRV